MATRQYIGARYVIKVYENSLDQSSAEWESGVTYEPLTMVTYQNSSYLSKKNVPGSVGDPAANPEYWAVTGAYNGQIAQLQNDVTTINNTLIAIDGRLDVLEDFANRKIMLIMDSYGSRVGTGGDTIDVILSAITGATFGLLAVSGGGAYNGAIATALGSYTGSIDYDTVMYIGGANDMLHSYAEVEPAMESLISVMKSTFSNTHNFMVMGAGTIFNDNYTADRREEVWKSYRDACDETSCVYVDNSQYILRNTALLETDGVHPNATGVDTLASFIVDALLTGSVDVYYEIIPTFTYVDTTSVLSGNYYMRRHNGEVQISIKGHRGFIYQQNADLNYNFTNTKIGEFSNTLIENSVGEQNKPSGIAFGLDGSNNEKFAKYTLAFGRSTTGISSLYFVGLGFNGNTPTLNHNEFVGNCLTFFN